MDIMKQPLHPRVWAWLELAIEAGVDGQGPIFASAKWATETSSSHLVQSALPEKEKMMMMMILKSVGAPFTGFWIPFRDRSCAGLRCNCTAASFAVDWNRAQRILFKLAYR